ncbi:MAG: Sir2 family NAD-dependent protein deacetylase [Rikenellaceae bacterium]
MKNNIVFFTGAGMSRESGLPTFRGEGGIWNEMDAAKVASKAAWYSGRYSNCKERRQAVLDFINPIRRAVIEHEPNEGHHLIASLEEKFNVTVITQNGDDYHTRAGSTNVIYLHGEALKNSSTIRPYKSFDIDLNNPDIKIGDKAVDGSQIRPYVIFFDEDLEMTLWKKAVQAAKTADYFVVIGCSLVVFPAVDLLKLIPVECKCYVINPDDVEMLEGVNCSFTHLRCGASEGMKEITDSLSHL